MNQQLTFEEMCKSEALLAEAEELANLGSWEHDLATGLISRSANLCRMLGSDPADTTVPEDFFWTLVDPEDHAIVRGIIESATNAKLPYEYQARFNLPDGRRRILLTRGKPIVDSQNRVIKRIGVAFDVTDRAETEKRIRESEERYRDLVENSRALICTHDLSGRLLSVNELPARMLGYRPEDLVGRCIPDMVEKETRDRWPDYIREIQECGYSKGYMVVKTRSGERLVWRFHNTLRTDGISTPTVRGMAHDITEAYETENKLRKSEALLAQAEQLANIGSWELNLEKQTLEWSQQCYRMLGLEPQSGPLPRGTGIRMIHPDDREKAIRAIENLREEGHEFDDELRFVTANGTVRLFHSRAAAVADESERVVRIRGMFQDVTDRKMKEEQLRRSEALLSQAEQLANVGSWEYDFRTGKARLSKRLMEFYGLDTDSEWNFEAFLERLYPEDRERLRKIRDRSLAEGRPWEDTVRYRAPGEESRILFIRGLPIAGADGKTERSIGVIQDITERVRINEELRKALRQLLHVRDDDRRRLARQLHESAGQTLAALLMSMRRLQETLPGKNTVADALWLSCHEIAQQAVREVRAISYSTHPPMLDEAGLGSALRCFASGFTERSGIEVSVNVPENFGRQSQEIETAVFRVVQEALTNVHRHSGSRTARIHLVCEDGQLRAEVHDDGCGFQLQGKAIDRHALGIGLRGMRECVEQLHGTLEIESVPERGTKIRVILPVAVTKPAQKATAIGGAENASRWLDKIKREESAHTDS